MNPRRSVLLVVALAVVATAFPTVAEAKKKGPKITVMTRNLFLGADLSPAIGASTLADAIDGAGEIWNEMQSTKFAERAEPLAREIKRSKADLVGLQEVALWRTQTPSDLGAPPTEPERASRPRRSSRTSSRSSSASSRRSAPATRSWSCSGSSTPSCPVDQDGNDATGRRLRRRVRRAAHDARRDPRPQRSKVKLGKTRSGHYTTRYEPNVGGIVLPVDRGWASVEARLEGQEVPLRRHAPRGVR